MWKCCSPQQNTFLLMETAQPQMSQKMSKKFFFYENFQNGGHQIPEKKLENQLKKIVTEQGITHVNVVLAVPFQNAKLVSGLPNNM